jgi:hypothetical protein
MTRPLATWSRSEKAPRCFVVDWVPDAAVMAKAKEAGMPEGDDSPLDWVEAYDCEETIEAKDFADAVAIANEKLPLGFWQIADIRRLVLIRTPGWKDRWVTEAKWSVEADSQPAEDTPEHYPEIDLYPHERMPA